MIVCGEDLNVGGRLVRTVSLATEGFEFLEHPEEVLADLRKSRRGADIFTFTQRLPDTTPKYEYSMEWDNVAALPISTFDNWWTRQIDGKTRNMVRRAEKKSVSVREAPFDDALVRAIKEIYDECPARQGRPFPHYRKDLETIHRMSATFLDTSVFIGAFLEQKLIGFAKLTINQARSQATVMHIIAMIQHRDRAPMNALMAESVRACAARGLPYLVYSRFSYGKKQRDTLADFKENNGFVRIELPRYYIPLTSYGRMALRLGLHRGLSHFVPEPVVAKIREIRRNWHNGNFRLLSNPK